MRGQKQHILFLIALTSTLTAGQHVFNNTSDDYDYFLLVRQWGATFCEEGHCTVRPVNRFSIHGLWPERIDGSWPSCCDSDYPFRIQKIIDLLPKLAREWFSYTAGIKYQCNWDDLMTVHHNGVIAPQPPSWTQRIVHRVHHLLSKAISGATRGRVLLGKGRRGARDDEEDHKEEEEHKHMGDEHKHREEEHGNGDHGHHHHHDDDNDDDHHHHEGMRHMHDKGDANATHHHHHHDDDDDDDDDDDAHHKAHHDKHHDAYHQDHHHHEDDREEDEHDHDEHHKDHHKDHHEDHHSEHQKEHPDMENDSPNYQFWQHEWEKHGTCALDVFRNEKDYFKTVLKLNHKYSIDEYLSDADIVPAEDPYRFKDVFKAITRGAGAEPFISCKDGKINEVWLCFDKDMTIFDCPPNKTPEFLKCGKHVQLPSAKTGKHHHDKASE